jgi:hypothetical protein
MSGRPAWRYRTLRHWKNLALAWLLVGMITVFVASWGFSRLYLSTTQHSGAVTIVAGLVVFLADAVCRIRDRELTITSRFIAPEAGGAVLSIPV